jgi:hypothetical protein
LHIIYDNLSADNNGFLENIMNHIDQSLAINSEDDKFVLASNRVIKTSKADCWTLHNTWKQVKENLLKRNHNKTKFILNLPTIKISEIEKLEVAYRADLNFNYDYLIYVTGLMNGNCDVIEELSLSDNGETDLHKFEIFLIKENLREIIFSFENNLEKVYLYFTNFLNFHGVEESERSEDLGISEKQDKNHDNNNQKSLYSDLLNLSIVDVIFSLILNTHNSDKNRVTYFSSLLFYFTKQNKRIHLHANTSILLILNNIPTLDIQSITNFSYFLSFYISNLQFKFEFKQDSSVTENVKGEVFFNMLLDSLANLGTKAKLEEILTSSPFDKELIENFLKSYSEKPNWKFYFGEQYQYDTVVINDHIHNKKEFESWKDKFESSGNDFVYVFLSCLFSFKSKTLTHLRETLNFYKEGIMSLVNTKEKQIVMLEALFDIWKNYSIYLRFSIEFLLNNAILDHTVLARYLIQKRICYHNENLRENFVNFDILIDIVVIHPFKSLDRSRILLSNEQKALAQSDENNQSNIIAHIEELEIYIEKMNQTCEYLPVEVWGELIKLYSSINQSNFNKLKKDEIINYTFERIIQFCRKFKRSLSENLNKIQEAYKNLNVEYAEIEKVIKNINSL